MGILRPKKTVPVVIPGLFCAKLTYLPHPFNYESYGKVEFHYSHPWKLREQHKLDKMEKSL